MTVTVASITLNLSVPIVQGAVTYQWFRDQATQPFATSDVPYTTDTLTDITTTRSYRVKTVDGSDVVTAFSEPFGFSYVASAPEQGDCRAHVQLGLFGGQEVGYIRVVSLPQTIDGAYLVDAQYSANVDNDGKITFPPLPQGAVIQVMIPAAKLNKRVTLPNTTLYQVI